MIRTRRSEDKGTRRLGLQIIREENKALRVVTELYYQNQRCTDTGRSVHLLRIL